MGNISVCCVNIQCDAQCVWTGVLYNFSKSHNEPLAPLAHCWALGLFSLRRTNSLKFSSAAHKDVPGFYISNSSRSKNGLIRVFLILCITFVSPLISQSAMWYEEAKWRTRQTEREREKKETRHIKGIASSVCRDRKRHCHTWLNEA